MKKLIIYLLLLFAGVLTAQTGSGEYSIKNIDVNTKNSDFGATFYGEKMVVFASPKKGVSLVNEVWEENGQRFLELYSANITDMESFIMFKV